MAKCKNCKHLKYKDDGRQRYAWCPLVGDCPYLEFERFCGAYKTMSQGDRIRSMTDEELDDFIEMKQFFALARNGTDGEDYTLNWLKSEMGRD